MDETDQSYVGKFGALETASGVMVSIRGVEMQLYNPRSVDAIKLKTIAPGSVERSYRVILPEGSAQSAQETLNPRMIWQDLNGNDNAWLDVGLIEKEADLTAPKTAEAQRILVGVKQTIAVMAHLKAGSVPDISGYIPNQAGN